MEKQLLLAAFEHSGRCTVPYSKDAEKAVKKLLNMQVRTDKGDYSVLFFNRIDKQAGEIEIMLSKVAIEHKALLLG